MAAAIASPPVKFVEVPVVGSDSVQWIDVSVPSVAASLAQPCAPATENAAGSSVVGDPPVYFIWRIHKETPNYFELLELCASNELPKNGLRLMFNHALCPFAFISRIKAQNNIGNSYIYIFTVSGLAYIVRLRTPSAYISGSVFPEPDFLEVDLRAHSSQIVEITSVTALPGLLAVGRNDGSVSCFEFEEADSVSISQGSAYELRDAGLSRLWGLVSRINIYSSVNSLELSEMHGRKFLYVLHADGSMRVWDLVSRVKIFSQIMSLQEFAGSDPTRLWVSDVDKDAGDIFIAILHRNELGQEVIAVHGLGVSFGDKFSLTPKSPVRHVPLGEGRLIDLRIGSNKLWVLKMDSTTVFSSFHVELDMGSTFAYSLQDAFVADQLFQGSEHSVDDLMYANYSITSLLKGPSAPFVSSLFLRKLLQPGIFQHAALGASLRHHKHHIMDYEIESLSSDGLRKQVLSVIEGQADAPNPFSVVCNWRSFCNDYLQYWCQSSLPYGLLSVGSAGMVGLIRKNSVSLFRCLEDIEAYAYGSFEKYNFVNSGLNLLDDDLDCEILSKILKCVGCISQRLGQAAAPALYESLANPVSISSDDIMSCLLKILEMGYDLPTTEHYISAFGIDSIIERKHSEHKKQRKFSVNLLLDLSALHTKVGSWRRIFDVIEKYTERLIPGRRDAKSEVDANPLFNINTSLLVVSISQFARVMFESACGLLLLLMHASNIQGQLQMSFDDCSRLQLELIPKIQEILLRWFIVHMLATSPCSSPALEDFSYQLSSLQIADNKHGKRIRCDRLGTYSSTLCSILLLEYPSNVEEHSHLTSRFFLGPSKFHQLLQKFVSWILSGRAGDESLFSLSHVIQLSVILIVHNQYEAVENLILTVGAHSCKKRTKSTQSDDGDWSLCLYLLGFCLLLRAHCNINQSLKEMKVREASHCFFRAAAGIGAYQAFQKLSFPQNLQCPGASYEALWKFNYYQWMMQVFEQYNMNEAASQFALVALEQVDEVHLENELGHGVSPESATNIRGRLWANVFKFSLDLGNYSDAYSAIISNPDEESKLICLRRFIIVLCEHGATKLLCGGELPFVGLMEKVEQELVWKAECSDIGGKPNTYKLLYAIQMHRHNWRRAAGYMYRYAVRLKKEWSSKDQSKPSVLLEERLHAIAVAINALHLVHPAYCWIDAHQERCIHHEQCSPNKKARKSTNEDGDDDWQFQEKQSFMNVEELEKEYVVASAEYFLTLANVKLAYAGHELEPAFPRSQSELQSIVDLLIQTSLHDMAFTVILKFWKGSKMKRELEKVFIVISQNCCLTRNGAPASHLFLTYSEGRSDMSVLPDTGVMPYHPGPQTLWKTLEFYLEKYKQLHPRLPVTVADELLRTDPHIELPLWLVHMFKEGEKPTSWGMTGSQSDRATLFRLFVDYGRYKEATSLLLEYLESFAFSRTTNILNYKKMFAVWFPYVAIERLWCDLQELKASGHMVDECDKLLKQLHGALLGHLKQVKLDSEDARSCGLVNDRGV